MEEEKYYKNYYRCPECGTEWKDEWSCTCNDRYPECDKETEPSCKAVVEELSNNSIGRNKVMKEIIKGDHVRKNHPYDGSSMAGKPSGPVLTVRDIVDHRPVEGSIGKDEIALLSDDSWEFVWNITKIKEV